MTDLKIQVADFNSVSDFLLCYYDRRKTKEPKFSYQTWAKEIGGINRNYLRLVAVGKRPVSQNLEKKLLQFFDFGIHEALIFRSLVADETSKDHSPTDAKRMVERLRGQMQIEITPEIRDKFLQDPMTAAALTLLTFADAPVHAKDLAERAGLTAEKAARIWNDLESLGLLKDGRVTNPNWKITTDLGNAGLRQHYLKSFENAGKAIDLPYRIRRFRSLFIALSEEEFADFLADLEGFIQAQLTKREPNELGKRQVYQLAISLFPAFLCENKKRPAGS